MNRSAVLKAPEAAAVTQTFVPRQPIWCAGCGHFGVQGAVIQAMNTLGIAAHETAMLAGIGCSGTMQNNLSAYGYHATHGRVLPTATGMAVANPQLTVVASGGDGDGYAIGLGHLLHTFRRNPCVLYIVMNNGTYGLTKGQPSPTAEPQHAPELPLDAVHLGLTLPGSTFLARGFVGRFTQLTELMCQAFVHVREKRGFAFLEVISPCVTYNDTYPECEAALVDLDAEPGYDPTERLAAAARYASLTAQGRLPVGLIYRGQARTYEQALGITPDNPPALQDINPQHHRQQLLDLLDRYHC